MIGRIGPRPLPGVTAAAVLVLGLTISGCSNSGVSSATSVIQSGSARPIPAESSTQTPPVAGPQPSSAPTPTTPIAPTSSTPTLPAPTLAAPASPAPRSPGPTPGPTPGPRSPAPTPGPRSPASVASVPPERASVSQVRNRLPAVDRRAGLRSKTVTWSGGGRLRVVPGDSAAPGKGRIHRVRVEVEAGLNIDRTAFATYVLATLNDRRSWTENGRRRFARTDGAADIRVVLASPETSAQLCRPLRTFGKLSCRQGDTAVLTLYRWTKAIPEYKGNHDGYRRYLINHEVGHTLGHRHEFCPGKGRMAPVMMQQTKGLQGCKPNSWPHP
jgi:hypothetical protein